MKHYVDSCTACTIKDAKIELLTQELNEYKQYDRRKERKTRGSIPWDEPYERRKERYPPSGYD